MKKFFSILDQLLEWASSLAIASFTLLIFLQVICRYALHAPLHWQEEVCQYLFYMVVLFGSIRAIGAGAHISVDFVSQRLSPRGRTLLKIIVSALMLVCCLYITYSGYLYCTSVGNRRSSELRILMKYIYALFPAAGALMSVCSLREVVRAVRQYREKEGDAGCC